MHLSKLILNPRNAGARRDISHPYEMHRTLYRAFDQITRTEADARPRILFRIEPERAAAGPVVLVQSDIVCPEWSTLEGHGYLLDVHGPKAFAPVFQPSQHLRFRLVANPTIKKATVGKKHNPRVPLVHARQADNNHGYLGYLDWLDRRANLAGFRVIHVQDAPFQHPTRNTKNRLGSKQNIPHFGVRFDGVLEVTDSEKLVEAVRNGIGPAKAFGFGLLSLAPA